MRGDGRLCRVPDDPLECVTCLLDDERGAPVIDQAPAARERRCPWSSGGARRGAQARAPGHWNDYITARRQTLPRLLRQASAVISPSQIPA